MSSAHHHHAHGNHDHYIHHQERKQHLFAVVVLINTAFILIETMAGLYANSNALLADAGHNASDVMSVLLAWLAVYLSSKRPTNRFTYGLKSSSILVSLFNSLLLWAACGVIAWHSVERLLHPAPTQGLLVLAVSTAGILVNGISAWLFTRDKASDLNVRGAYWHFIADALVSAVVAVSGLLIWWTNWSWIDGVTSLAVVVFIMYSTWGLLRESAVLSLQGVPEHIDIEKVRTFLISYPGVVDVHDLHCWPIGTTDTALTAHMRVEATIEPNQTYLNGILDGLHDHFGIQHVTIQTEKDGEEVHCQKIH